MTRPQITRRIAVPDWRAELAPKPSRHELTLREGVAAFAYRMAQSGGRDGRPAKPGTMRALASNMPRILEAFGDLTFREITTEFVVAEIKAQRKAKIAENTIGLGFYFLNQFFKWAISVGAADTNPCRDVSSDVRPKKRRRNRERSRNGVLTISEIRALLLSTEIPFERQVLYAILILTGARVGEAVALVWRNWSPEILPLGQLVFERTFDAKAIDPETGKRGAFVPTKTDEVRSVAVSRLLNRFFHRLREVTIKHEGRAPMPDELMCTRYVKTKDVNVVWQPQTVLQHLRRDLARVGIATPATGNRCTKDQRNTFINRCRRAGADGLAVEAMTHVISSSGMGNAHREYVHIEHEDKCRAIDCLDRALGVFHD